MSPTPTTTETERRPLLWRTALHEPVRRGTVDEASARLGDHLVCGEAPSLLADALAPPVPASFVTLVERAGGPPGLAEKLWNRGITGEEATAALTLAMWAPELEAFGPARVLVEVLGMARREGALTAEQVRERVQGLANAVAVRPDGVLVRAFDGRALERRSLAVRDGRLEAGGLGVGGLFAAELGVLRRIGPEGRPEDVVGELALERGAINAALDGVEEGLAEVATGIAALVTGLRDAPEETLSGLFHAFAGLPKELVRVAFAAPEELRAFRRLPAEEQVKVATKLVTHLVLALEGAGAARGAAGTAKSGLGAVQVQVGLRALREGAAVATLRLEGLGELAAAGAAMGGAGSKAGLGLAAAQAGWPGEQPLLRSRDGDLADAKVRFANQHHLDRRLPGTASDASRAADLRVLLEAVDGHPNAQRLLVRQVREQLERFGFVALDDVAEIHAGAKRLLPEARAELDALVHGRFRDEIAKLDALPKAKAQVRAAEIRSAADAAGLDLRRVYSAGASPPPLSSLSAEARRGLEAIQRGEREIRVSSRAVAEEILGQYPDLANTTGWPKSKTKALLPEGFGGTFHWDDVRGPNGRVVGHGPDNPHGGLPHLQLTRNNRAESHIFFPWPSR